MYIQLMDRLERSLEQLRRGDGRASMAARTAEGIIRSLAAGDVASVNHKLTSHGEARLEKAVKFDLGAGYRMVSVRAGEALLMLFAGSHDDCDRWLERNRGMSFDVGGLPEKAPASRQLAPTNAAAEEPLSQEPEEAHDEELSQRELRLVFRGLCGG
jgi:hypothetical protein